MIRIQDIDDGENRQSKSRSPQTVTPTSLSASDIEQVNQTLTAGLALAPIEIDRPGELYIGPKDCGQMFECPDDLEIGTLYVELIDGSGEDETTYLPNGRESVPLFPSRTAGTQKSPRRLPEAVSPSRRNPNWHVSAPDIERAIQTLSAKLDRAPTQTEIAEELRIDLKSYWQVLSYLRDLGIGTLYTDRTADSGEEELVYQPNGPGDDTLYRCLRSEMQDVLREAIRNLPERERLVITFHYCECMNDKEISLTLDIPQSTVSTIRTSAHIQLRASLASSMLSEQLRELCARQTHPKSLEEVREQEAAHVVVSGSQSGWLPKGHSWERFGAHASLYRRVRSWYSLNDEHELTQIRRNEDYHLKLEL